MLTLLLLAFFPLPDQQFGPPPQPPASIRAALLEQQAASQVWLTEQAGDLPGVVLAVVDREGIVFTLTTGTGDPAKTYRIGSITKTFVAAAALAMWERRTLLLDVPVAEYLRPFAKVVYPTTDSPRVTIRHLLTHTSGLPRVGPLDYTGAVAPDDAALEKALDGLVLEAAPGTRVSYSNLGYTVLGAALAKAAGQPDVRAVVQKYVLDPLKLSSARWSPDARSAPGHHLVDGRHVPRAAWTMGVADAAGGLLLDITDLAAHARWQLSAWPPSNLAELGPLKRATLRMTHRVLGPAVHDETLFGGAWAIGSGPGLGRFVNHAGATFSYAAMSQILLEKGLAVVALTNTGGEAGSAGPQLAQLAEALARRLVDALPGDALDPRVQAVAELVCAQLNAPDEATFAARLSPTFAKAVPPAKLVGTLGSIKAQFGACASVEPIKGEGLQGSARLKCGLKDLVVRIRLEEAAPHLIAGLLLQPAP